MRMVTRWASVETIREGQLRDSLPDGLSDRTMRHAPKGAGKSLIIAGSFLLFIGAWLAIGTMSWPDVVLNETSQATVSGPAIDGVVTHTVPVPSAGRYSLVFRDPASTERGPMLSEFQTLEAVTAQVTPAGYAVSYRDGATSAGSGTVLVVYAVPTANPQTRVDLPRLVRNLAIAAIGLGAVATGLTLGRRRRAALHAYADSIEASLASNDQP